MAEGVQHEYDKYINPILNNPSIWRNSDAFRQARKKLYATLRFNGYNNNYIENVMAELFKRWEPLYLEDRKTSIIEC